MAMDFTKLMLSTAMQQTGINAQDVEQIKVLIKELSLMPGKVDTILENQNRIESKLDILLQSPEGV